LDFEFWILDFLVMSRGLFFSLDGLDGCGKSTQCRLLADYLQAKGLRVTTCVDPGGTAVGAELREILLHHHQEMTAGCEALLFMASRAQLVHEVIRPALDAQHIVISDRFLLATVVYQGHAGGLDPEQLWQAGKLSTGGVEPDLTQVLDQYKRSRPSQWRDGGGVEPDLTLVLDLPVEVAAARRTGPKDRFESRGPEFHARVRKGFQLEAGRHRDRMAVIDADRPPEVVFQAICREIEKFDLQVAKGG
jgi:dTMP kinase